MEVVIVRSARRRRTVEAKVVGGVIRVSVPAGMEPADERRHVARLVGRLERRQAGAGVDLSQRAAALARRHRLERPRSIRWVGNQEHRWGSCTPADRTVRISDRLAGRPLWVVDYVLVHELAHLTEPGHTPEFWALVNRYPLAERARGYLMALGMSEAGCD